MSQKSHVVKDPVCGVELKPKEVQARSENEGKTYYFCSIPCKEKFEAEHKKKVA